MTTNTSLAAQAVASGPAAIAPPSFDGQGWLVVINLTVMTAAAAIAAMVLIYIAQMAIKGRRGHPGLSPVRVWRIIGALFAACILLRCGVEAANIWGWDPMRPAETARFLYAKRLIDPVAVACGIAGLATYVLSGPGMTHQLRREPLPIDMWQDARILRNMVALTLLSLVAAIGVVATR